MNDHKATVFVDYQQRASEFSVGDLAVPLAGAATDESQAGKVVAVYPAIGQVDIEFAWGSGRYPVEDVQRVTDIASKPPATEHNTVPGGAGSVSVPGGPVKKASVDRVAQAFVKQALYWASRDRHYRATKAELDSGKYGCPRCKRNGVEEVPFLRPAAYKMSEGKKHRLMGCPHCLFLIKQEHIVGHPSYSDPHNEAEEVGEDSDLVEILAEWDGTMEQGFESVRSVRAAEDDVVLEVVLSGGDAAKNMSELMAYIKKNGDPGHSFGIVVDPDDSEYRREFGFDGDGADRIVSVKLDGKTVGV